MKKTKNQNDATEPITVSPAEEPIKKKKKKKRKKAPIIIVLVIVILIAVRLFACGNTGAPAVVTTARPILGDVEESISTSGIVSSEEQKTYFAQVSGVLGTVHVEAGGTVKRGDLLISYDMERMERNLKEASLQQLVSASSYSSTLSSNSKSQSKLQEANTNLAVLNQQIADFESYLNSLQEKLESNQRDTSKSLAEESLSLSTQSSQLQREMESLNIQSEDYAQEAARITQKIQEISAAQARNSYLQQVAGSTDYVVKMQKEIEDVQKRLAECKEYKAEMESQKATNENTVLDTYQQEQYSANNEISQLAYQQVEEDYYTAKQGLTAEFDGIVLDCTALEGAMVTSGMQLLTLADSNRIKVTFSASKYDLEKLEIGQKADITISGNVYEGEVSKINRMAVMSMSGTPMVDVELHITNPDDRIILGLDAKITIHTAKAENALLIPVEAINADKEGDFLFVTVNGKVVKRPVVCGISSDTYVEIMEGITEEDEVILYSYSNLEEGVAVTAMSTATVPSAQTPAE